MQGLGTMKWSNGKHFNYYYVNSASGNKYEGSFIADMKEVQGTFTWADGRKYIGDWKAGKQHGSGIFV
jgi:hypothetical protein